MPLPQFGVSPQDERRPGAHAGRKRILVVEDDPGIRSLVGRMLTREGYDVCCAAGADEALAMAASSDPAIDLVVCDVVLPGLNGREVVARLQAGCAGTRAIYMSGHTTHSLLANGTFQEENPFLHKPFTPSELAMKVREVLHAE